MSQRTSEWEFVKLFQEKLKVQHFNLRDHLELNRIKKEIIAKRLTKPKPKTEDLADIMKSTDATWLKEKLLEE